MIFEFLADGGLKLAPQLEHVLGRSDGVRLDGGGIVLNAGRLVAGLRRGGGIGIAAPVLVGRERAHGLESMVNGAREFPYGLVVAIGGGKQDDKESEHQSHEVRIGDQPSLMAGRLRGGRSGSSWTPHRFATFAKPRRGTEVA